MMALTAPPLPMRFPCWCRAVYSYGGETKRDLGFIEGDLIECLNAGDGSWWMGRLRRDKRMVGLFPSNFVEVLDESFAPSPIPSRDSGGSISRANSPNPSNPQSTPQKSKSMFRKPFQAYAAAGSPNPEAAARQTMTPPGSLRSSHKPFSSMKRAQPPGGSRATSPAPPTPSLNGPSRLGAVSPAPSRFQSRAASPNPAYQPHFRAASPAPPSFAPTYSRVASPNPHSFAQTHSRAASPNPHSYARTHSRAASPNPHAFARPHSRGPSPQHYSFARPHSRAASPQPYHIDEPPPPPPPHRVAYNPSRAPSPRPLYTNGSHTPEMSGSPSRDGFTPSPLTSAMNDVMSSLHNLGRRQSDVDTPNEPPTPPNIWSPESFNVISQQQTNKIRAQTSLGVSLHDTSAYDDEGYDVDDEKNYNAAPNVGNYVQRMEARLRKLHEEEDRKREAASLNPSFAPEVPPKSPRPGTSHGSHDDSLSRKSSRRSLRTRKSAYELGHKIGRTLTLKSTATNSTSNSANTNASNSTHATSQSLMSGYSATGMSATSAGSLARRRWPLGISRSRPGSSASHRDAHTSLGFSQSRPQTPVTGVTYHSSHNSSQQEWNGTEGSSVLGGLTAPKAKKSGFLKKMLESSKTVAASARSTISSAQSMSRPGSRQQKVSAIPNGITAIAGGTAATPSRPTSSAARDMGLGNMVDWMQVRRDVNRSNSLSNNERVERAERCQMLDLAVISPVETLLHSVEGDEGLDGLPIQEPTDFASCNLSLVDKTARFVANLPPMTNAASLVQGYICRPYRSDVQRLRAIFTWVAERIAWEEDFDGEIDTRRVIQSKRGCTEEIAVLVMEMCGAVGIHAEVVRGFLKAPGGELDIDMVARPNHWWNAVIVDGEWRLLDCALASPTNPRRSQYSSAGSQVAETWWFLTRPSELCYTHVPLLPEQQHICPPMPHGVLMALPCASPTYFKHKLHITEFDTSQLHLENLEMAHIHLEVPEDVECVAEIEVRAFAQDVDGDFFESGEVHRKPALAQADWVNGQKRYTIKALLPGDEGQGVLKVHAGKRGLKHSIKSNPHSLALALPLRHTGQNPPYAFLTRHPTPHAQRHDLYVVQPQCHRLACNNTFVFSVRQHPSTLLASPNPNVAPSRAPSPNPFARPASAMSMASVSAAGSQFSHPSTSSGGGGERKPAKLAVQSPAGKIIRLTRRSEMGDGQSAGGTWETVVKIGELGTWRGLVLADRSARWCVFAEWECV
ncbi:hypothetical protein P152DRAFT_414095 [Eremomyces bilateralis CBS 781.70]|uniref:SH3 domain-containing protein n=1 Tax=Eremomyces bilateralis CBS 781.70 TaxID=1392243 RepID=A0A6G1G6R9_9PEZI|nr:uncharacterized protein P152DRAFT_414095 [Eremomyces bilateralis CBS 781.70]KAF1813738.1 hypothetical protein P152DRAFT_414095 [Eremomyces bilateralis CBS 781.70]